MGLEAYKKIRQVFTINPKTRIKKSKKLYNRNKVKTEIRKEIKECG
jgi:hypothetical protein